MSIESDVTTWQTIVKFIWVPLSGVGVYLWRRILNSATKEELSAVVKEAKADRTAIIAKIDGLADRQYKAHIELLQQINRSKPNV